MIDKNTERELLALLRKVYVPRRNGMTAYTNSWSDAMVVKEMASVHNLVVTTKDVSSMRHRHLKTRIGGKPIRGREIKKSQQ